MKPTQAGEQASCQSVAEYGILRSGSLDFVVPWMVKSQNAKGAVLRTKQVTRNKVKA
jgi:hypothetical protein